MNAEEEILTSAFDSAALSYDTDFTFSNMGILQRKRVYYFLEKILSKESKRLEILEINCGTGEDARWFAEKGHSVIATDASEKMIDMATHKKQELFEVCSYDKLIKKYSNKKFDLIFSNFGGLNCINEVQLKKLSADLFSLLKPGGKFVAVLMGKKCLWEQIYFILKLNFKKAFRRLSSTGVDAVIGDQIQKTFYYSPAEFANLYAKEFKTIMKKPVGFVLPPSYLESFFKNKTWLLQLLNLKEKVFPFSFLSNFADHYFIVLQRSNNIS
ncbi:MAG: class I SAM-dependent methyltransferase [Bacteroidia bacterium]